jgi:hypothetical protein
MIIELDKREREIIVAHLSNSPVPYVGGDAKREVERLLKKLQAYT